MKILSLCHGLYGQRITENIRLHIPDGWSIEAAELPKILPLIVDEPEDFLPPEMPNADLVLHLAGSSQAAQLLPGVIRLTGARAVIAPIDNDTWIPRGLRRQLHQELAEVDAAITFPEPFCALSEDVILATDGLRAEQKDLLLAFNRYFGRPRLRIVSKDDETIAEVIVERAAACGSSQYAAERLRGVPLRDAVPKGGLICLHYPCLASMEPTRPKDGVENLMHLSGVIFNEELEKALRASDQAD